MPPVNRRQFLAATTAVGALAAGALPRAVRADQPQPVADGPTHPPGKRTLKKAVMFGMIADPAATTIKDKFQLLKDTGFHGVEMDSPSRNNPDEILAAMDSTGIKVHGLVDSVHWQYHLNSPEPAVRDKGREALETALRDGKKFGAVSILLVPALVNENQPYDDAWHLSQEQINKVLPLAAECKVKIAIENVWNSFLLSPLEAARYVDELKSPWAAWHFDIGNVINYGWPHQWVRILGTRIAKLHIKDFSRKKRDEQGLWKGFDVELGDGDANWPATMTALDGTGYATDPQGNWATAEVKGGDRARLQQISNQMDKLFAM